jgi:hypothetical protein
MALNMRDMTSISTIAKQIGSESPIIRVPGTHFRGSSFKKI